MKVQDIFGNRPGKSKYKFSTTLNKIGYKLILLKTWSLNGMVHILVTANDV